MPVLFALVALAQCVATLLIFGAGAGGESTRVLGKNSQTLLLIVAWTPFCVLLVKALIVRISIAVATGPGASPNPRTGTSIPSLSIFLFMALTITGSLYLVAWTFGRTL